MSYVLAGLILAWAAVLLVFAARWLNDLRAIHNHIAPDASDMNYMKPGLYHRWRFRFSSMDPSKLTSVGRERLRVAIWNERAMWIWIVAGFLLCPFLIY